MYGVLVGWGEDVVLGWVDVDVLGGYWGRLRRMEEDIVDVDLG